MNGRTAKRYHVTSKQPQEQQDTVSRESKAREMVITKRTNSPVTEKVRHIFDVAVQKFRRMGVGQLHRLSNVNHPHFLFVVPVAASQNNIQTVR